MSEVSEINDIVGIPEVAVSLASIADSLRKIADEPFVEIKPAMPQCPFCQTINPQIELKPTGIGAKGNIAELIVVGNCLNCRQEIFAIPHQIVVFRSRDEAAEHMGQKLQMSEGYNG